jgi:hypothetical protein
VTDPHFKALDAAIKAGHLRSRRALDDLRELYRFSARHAQVSEVRALRDHLPDAAATS